MSSGAMFVFGPKISIGITCKQHALSFSSDPAPVWCARGSSGRFRPGRSHTCPHSGHVLATDSTFNSPRVTSLAPATEQLLCTVSTAAESRPSL